MGTNLNYRSTGPIDKGYGFAITKAKCVFLGEQGVGKTCIVTRFTNETFDNSYEATIGIDFLSKTTMVNNKYVRLQLWDTAGQERFKSLIPSYIRDSAVAVIVYDISLRKSFDTVDQWLDEVRLQQQENMVIFLVGNKVDLTENRVVSRREGEEKAYREGIHFCETSARSGYNIQKLFQKISEEILKVEALKSPSNGFQLGPPSLSLENRKRRCWCFT